MNTAENPNEEVTLVIADSNPNEDLTDNIDTNKSEITMSVLSVKDVQYADKTRIILQPNEELIRREDLPRKHACFYIVSYVILIGGFPGLIYLTWYLVDDYETYFYQRAYNFGIGFIISYITGAFFKKYLGLKTAYTRKILHLVAFSMPLIIDAISNELHNATADALWAMWQTEIWMGCFYTIPLRNCSNKICGNPTKEYNKCTSNALTYCNCCELIIDALDRPEDRPNTLLWLQTQIILTYIFYIALALIFQYDTASPMLLLIPVFVGGLGDGLAEPVGVAFGKNGCGTGKDCTFRARGCCTKHDYTRSIPGSLMVLMSGYIGVAAAYNDFTMYQFIAALVIIPPLGAIVEAKAPHTLDNPFIVLFVGAASFGILYIPY